MLPIVSFIIAEVFLKHIYELSPASLQYVQRFGAF